MTVSRAVSLRISAKLGISVVKVRNWLLLLPRSERLTHVGCYARVCLVGHTFGGRVVVEERVASGLAGHEPDRTERALRARHLGKRGETECAVAGAVAVLGLEDGFGRLAEERRAGVAPSDGEHVRPVRELAQPGLLVTAKVDIPTHLALEEARPLRPQVDLDERGELEAL